MFPKPRKSDHSKANLSEPDRYDSAIGWDPDAELEERKRIALERLNMTFSETFDIRNGGQLSRSAIKKPAEIFRPFWREGELCVFTGEASVGKTIFAIQLAECIARGENFFVNAKGSKRKAGRNVFYFDFERTHAQLQTAYTANGRKYAFSSRFDHAPLFPDFSIPGEYVNKLWLLFRQQIGSVVSDFVEQTGKGGVIIIDNISYIAPREGPIGIKQTLRFLKLWVQSMPCSVLVLLASNPRHAGPRPLTEAAISGRNNMLGFADSVIALGRTPIDPEYRYLKQLRSRSAPIVYGADNVAVFKLGRMPKPGFDPPPVAEIEDGTGPAEPAASVVEHPFLGFKFEDTVPESFMLHDLAAEAARDAEREERRRFNEAKRINRLRQTSARTALAEGFIDGSLKRYFLNE